MRALDKVTEMPDQMLIERKRELMSELGYLDDTNKGAAFSIIKDYAIILHEMKKRKMINF